MCDRYRISTSLDVLANTCQHACCWVHKSGRKAIVYRRRSLNKKGDQSRIKVLEANDPINCNRVNS